MKNSNFIFFFISLLLIIFCEEVEENSSENLDKANQTEVIGELKKKREENNKKFKNKLNEYLKELKIENAKTITRDQFKNIFFKLFEFGKKELNKDEEEKEEKVENKIDKNNDLDLNKDYIDKIFNNLINQEIKEIEVNKIIEYFEPSNILYALKDCLKAIDLNNTVDNLSETIMHTLNAFDEKKTKNDNEKNSDL